MNPLHLIWIIPVAFVLGAMSRIIDRSIALSLALEELIRVQSAPRSNGESWSEWKVRQRAAFSRAERVLRQ